MEERGKEIKLSNVMFIDNFAIKLREKYAETLKEINMNAGLKDILEVEKILNGKIREEFSRDIKNFLYEIDE